MFALGVSIKLELLGDVNCLIIQKLCNLFVEEESVYTLMNVGIAFGGLMTLLFYQWRNQATEKQTKTQYETFNQDKQFSNYLEATKLLTDKKSTPDAKIAAMFSLAGVARDHSKDVGRIVQVINQELIPLINCVNAKYEKSNLSNGKVIELVLQHTEEDRKIIKEWRHNGDDNERIFSTALYVIRKIILGLQSSNTNVDISNTIIFDVDTDFYEEAIKIDTLFSVVGKERPVENLTFFHCKLEKIDIIKEARYHFCQFINCNLTKANFNKANLWGTVFINCDLEGVKFEDTECEGIEFKKCKNLSLKQLKQMKFENLKDAKGYEFENIQNIRLYESKNKDGSKNKEPYSKKDLKYLIVIDDKMRVGINKSIENRNKKYSKKILKYLVVIDKKTRAKINKFILLLFNQKLTEENFITRKEYDEWKNSSNR